MTIRTPSKQPPNIRTSPNVSPLNIIDSQETDNLWSILYSDQVNIYGDECKYIKVQHNNLIEFFGEYRSKILQNAYSIRVINNSNIETNTDTKTTTFMTSLGITVSSDINISVPKMTFQTLNIIPLIGDAIYFERTNRLYTIQFVSADTPDKFQGQDFSYNLKLSLYSANSNTTVAENVEYAIPDISFLETLNQEIVNLNNVKVDQNVSSGELIDNSEVNGRI